MGILLAFFIIAATPPTCTNEIIAADSVIDMVAAVRTRCTDGKDCRTIRIGDRAESECTDGETAQLLFRGGQTFIEVFRDGKVIRCVMRGQVATCPR